MRLEAVSNPKTKDCRAAGRTPGVPGQRDRNRCVLVHVGPFVAADAYIWRNPTA